MDLTKEQQRDFEPDTLPNTGNRDDEARAGSAAAALIWEIAAGVDAIKDPRSRAFADAVTGGLGKALGETAGALKQVMQGAANAAEDLNVEPFQGLIEVIQNADDIKATEVRFALREGTRRELLIVHNGEPVTCHHVLGMALPFITSKTERTDQRGRFGIGLKTLKRIATDLTVHSSPYHFSIDQLELRGAAPEAALPSFYDPAQDTLIVLRLKDSFDEDALRSWFERWDDDGLIFLASVSRFRWCEINGEKIAARILEFGEWQSEIGDRRELGLRALKRRTVTGENRRWTVWRADIDVPPKLHPSHKARSQVAHVSIALPDRSEPGALYIGFKTRIPVGLPFSIDAQFDPSTSREDLLDNDWNSWLAKRCGDVTAAVAIGLLEQSPATAWRLVPLAGEKVGTENDAWLRSTFEEGFTHARETIGEHAMVRATSGLVSLRDIAYDDPTVSDLLLDSDIELLAPGKRALPPDARDNAQRWRVALDEIGVSECVGTAELLGGFIHALFTPKPPEWWVRAGSILVDYHPDQDLFGAPFLLDQNGQPLACRQPDESTRPIILSGAISPFAERWQLVDRLNPSYTHGDDGEAVTTWLDAQADFHFESSPEAEVTAFAARFADEKLEIEVDQLRELRDRFDDLTQRAAARLGPKVGAAILLDGHVFKNNKTHRQKVSPASAYLCKTLDSDGGFWPIAAGAVPNIQWISARYDEQLKTGGTRRSRKRADGVVPRGPRKFLTLLGAEIAPRLEDIGHRGWIGGTRDRELRAAGATFVPNDIMSPDLERVIAAIRNTSKKERRERGPALMKALGRSWTRVYERSKRIASKQHARKYIHDKGLVTADWLNKLRESAWVVVGKGELVPPAEAIIKTSETSTLYDNSAFALDVDIDDIEPEFIDALKIITTVRVSDFVDLLREIRDGGGDIDDSKVMQLYRSIAKHVPKNALWHTLIGDISLQQLRAKMTESVGPIHVGGGVWRPPHELFRGQDIFHDRSRFVPGGPSFDRFWEALGVREPDLDDCLRQLRDLAGEPAGAATSSILIDVYRHMEPLLEGAERRHKERLRALPLMCLDGWKSVRPVFLVQDAELRFQLAQCLPHLTFWNPPCDVRDLDAFVSMTGIVECLPRLTVIDDRDEAFERGEGVRMHFAQAVDHLSNELARNEPQMRERMALGWDELRSISLHIYPGPVAVHAFDEKLSSGPVRVHLQALITRAPAELHAWEEALPKRDHGGHAVASLFPAAAKSRQIEAEWVVAWQDGRERVTEILRLTSDERHAEVTEERKDKIAASLGKKVTLAKPVKRTPDVKPRTLKQGVVSLTDVAVVSGKISSPAAPTSPAKLHTTAPPVSTSLQAASSAPLAYSTAELEQRGWELLVVALETSPDEAIVDFRQRRAVGADGVIEWKTFVEMKATGRQPQGSIEMSNAEYERAKERGSDFILALVSGLEDGFKDQVRLIIDPANRATVRPINGVKLVALADAPSIVVSFDHVGDPDDDE